MSSPLLLCGSVLNVRQTFIRGAAGRALTDSPALNTLSRQVLVPVARPLLPAAVTVSGPGPKEPARNGSVSSPQSGTKPTPPIPAGDEDLLDASSSGEHNDDGDGDGDGEGEGEGEEDSIAAHAAQGSDPYANLDSAFGAYAADQPKPQTNDLLF